MTRRFGLLFLLVVSACSSTPARPEPPSGGSNSLPTDPNCPGPAPTATATCVQDCGPPVARDSDPPPPYRWLTTSELQNREKFGCPRCLDGTTRIATPDGDRAINSLSVGDIIYTETRAGTRIAAPLLEVVHVPAPPTHRLVVLSLADGRTLRVSSGHPLAVGGLIGQLAVGSEIDGSRVVARAQSIPTDAMTWDVLPAGDTGHYWANDVLLGSTLAK